LSGWFEKQGDAVAVSGKPILQAEIYAFTSSIKKDLVFILLSLIFRLKNILNIFKTIKRNKIKA
jgi:hypothetical protein